MDWHEIMPFDIKCIQSKSRDYPSSLREKKTHELFHQIWTLGNLDILKRPLLGFFCSVKCPGNLILQTYDLARVLRGEGIPVISGFHSPIEKDCLELLLRGTEPIVFCPARSIENMRLRKELKEPINDGRLLLLSPFEGKVRRPTIQISEQRNRFVSAMATSIFVTHAERDGKIEAFCREILAAGKPLYTFESDYNRGIIGMGAKPVNPQSLTGWIASIETKG